jgi:hypothetical protein
VLNRPRLGCKRIAIHAVSNGSYKRVVIHCIVIDCSDEMMEMISEKSGKAMLSPI